MNYLPAQLHVSLPAWAEAVINQPHFFNTDQEKMAFVIELARHNVQQGTGGPFAAAILDESGHLVSIGINQVVAARNSVLHAEILAIMLAEKAAGSFSLAPGYELFSSCEPCAMCLGATLWSGVRRLVWAATGEDARSFGFDEGPVFAESWQYLRDRGVVIEQALLRTEARAVMQLYHDSGGTLYNAR